jgi:hypothetical protein
LKKKVILIIVGLIQFLRLGAQNLVPNPSFETYTACPTGFSQLSNALSWYGTNNSSELYNVCSISNVNVPNAGYGFQNPRTGNAFSGQYFLNGFGTNYREYMQTTNFVTPLVANNCYLVRFYVSFPNKLKYACNNIAAHISVSGYTTTSTGLPATSFSPQIYLTNNPIIKDSLNWVEIAGVYTAVGGENHITIGNFKNDANTDTLNTNYGTLGVAYYYIDDVSVEQITVPTWQLRDTMILVGDSVLIGPLYSGLPSTWYNMSGVQIGTGSGIWVKPNTTTSYILHAAICGNTFADTMKVLVSAVGINENSAHSKLVRLFPNPTNGEFTLESIYSNIELREVEISDIAGQVLINKNLHSHKTTLQPELAAGIYLVKVKLQNGTMVVQRLIISN